ncbi:sugar phosphate isomerase/epimerase [Panacibacter sp. DH6]|uniref:Sugar phosphate isomerase/epimerase n=1 Tax=Panacibacter microcysteis TaxID=2793269 RepID=A0A931GVH1_9BACT|nr:sugar phosphate isomerase/epimerase family protein [Panacibacter microcysteis]MBG9377816.1 sugar phosphate isomerase/epimerase [Panacibacter microcysteis]
MNNRRKFLQQTMLGAAAMFVKPSLFAAAKDAGLKISLAEWSLHRALQSGKLDHLDFPATAKNDFGIDAVEYVNGFFGGKKMHFKEAGKNAAYLKELLRRSKDAGVYNHLLMIDDEGSLALPGDKQRLQAVDNHKKWIEAAALLGCKTIRVNLHGSGDSDDKKTASVDSLSRLCEFAAPMNINVVVENHGSDSSKGFWLADVMKQVGKPNVGTLPDFGNFCISHPWGTTQGGCKDEYDRYKGVAEMLPYAKGVSAKTYDFDSNGNQPLMDYDRLMKIVKDAGFKGYIGVEFEGNTQDEAEGIRKTKTLVEKYL